MRDGSINPTLSQNPPFSNKFGVNPLLVHPGTLPTSDFRLQVGSPAIDAGTAAFGVAATDLDGNSRTLGAVVDIGSYEKS